MIPAGERQLKIVIGENIEKYFTLSTFTSITAFANEICLDSVRVRKVMSSEASVSIEKLQLIADVLNVKTIDLIEDWS